MNRTLTAGMAITLLMIVTAFFGPLFAPYDLEIQVKSELTISEDGNWDMVGPPLPPSAAFPLGTDLSGRDLLTLMLHGAKYTLFFSLAVALARVGIGGFIGAVLGYNAKADVGKVKKASSWGVLNGIPAFLVVWFILYSISFNPSVSAWKLSAITAVLFIVLGLPSIVFSVKDKTIEIKKRPFILASKSIGAGRFRIICTHIFPHLKEGFLILIVNEVILTLSLLGQLAIFDLFIGGTVMSYDTNKYFSRTYEWAGLIGAARNGFLVHPWILFVPLTAYGILLVGFYFISKGLETRYKDTYSRYSQV
ncbi:ABC transporter permease [Paenibacillus thermotolerans]|uniref:ABC transporter permease n=1 Tax=Paenibacillus thermotolerans TaxID=3027807 RepID=UPI0023689783|nr:MULTISPECIES: ABC transporter permease subunit [unclassified Paenibacillus]